MYSPSLRLQYLNVLLDRYLYPIQRETFLSKEEVNCAYLMTSNEHVIIMLRWEYCVEILLGLWGPRKSYLPHSRYARVCMTVSDNLLESEYAFIVVLCIVGGYINSGREHATVYFEGHYNAYVEFITLLILDFVAITANGRGNFENFS